MTIEDVHPQPLDTPDAADLAAPKLHLLDMGRERYGDCILCRFGDVTVLVDGGHPRDLAGRGGHPSIPDQLARLLGHGPPFDLSLLVVTHAHADHVGCLPALVERGDLRPEWALVADEGLSFGRAEGEGDPLDGPGVTPLQRRLVAALREEGRADERDAAALAAFLEDAAALEPRYRAMLATLEERGTRVVRFGRDDHGPLEEAFAGVGLRVLGPSQDHLLICAEAISRLTRDALDAVAGLVSESPDADDDPLDAVALYRSLAGRSFSDAADRPGRGAALNDQSAVLRFEVGGHRVLLTGDMQLAKPEVAGLGPSMAELREAIRDDGPYGFVKLAHHGSYNGLDAGVLADLGESRCFAVSGGIDDPTHPDPEVLRLLRRNLPRVRWARTDRNGLVTVSLASSGVRLRVERGELDDATANTDVVSAPGWTGGPAPTPAVLPQAGGGPGGGATVVRRVETADGMVEVTARIPHAATRVTLTIDVEPRGAARVSAAPAPPVPGPAPAPPAVPGPGPLPELRPGGGRELPPLLFVTSAEGLARSIGQAEAAHLLTSLRRAGQAVYDELPAPPAGFVEAARAAAQVHERLEPWHRGVVLLGGYDVVPAQRLDTLDRGLREQLPVSHGDEDDFIVWSDDVYGDLQGDSFPEVPVSRIPDGLSAELVFNAVQAGGMAARARRFGLHNLRRPFAREVFALLPGEEGILASEETRPQDVEPAALDAEAVYLMLHGTDGDGSRFWGEDEAGTLEAINVGNLPARSPAVVFTGCCWGALTVDRPAARAEPGRVPAPRTPASSMALAFLRSGALAFVGCTGSHYSPTAPPYDYFGAPLHVAFWQHLREGRAPAEALLLAKRDYLEGMPHGRRSAQGQAIERKILWQYTCLGLGW